MQNNKSLIKEKIALAIHEHKKGNLEFAERTYKEILKTDSDNFEVVFLLGTLCAQIKKFEESKDLLIRSIKIKSYHADSHNNLGNVYKELGNFIEASRSYKKAISIDPKNVNFLNNYALTLYLVKNYQKCIDTYNKALSYDPGNTVINFNLAFAYKKIGKYEKSMNCLQIVLKKNPNNKNAKNIYENIKKELNEKK